MITKKISLLSIIPLTLTSTFALQSCAKAKKPIKAIGIWGDAKFIREYNDLSYKDNAESVQFINDPTIEKSSSIMYQILVYSFADGNGDGIGDFIGLKNKLDYLKNLGVDQLYLSPIHPASSYHGYDVIDYAKVAPELGGQKAFDAFLKKAHKMGFKVYMDMVFNHTSYSHPWFQKALQGDSKYMKYYHFGDDNSSLGDTHSDDGFGDSFLNIKEHAITNKSYISKFWKGMPDLNLDNEDVINELKNIQYFWTKKGIDGFRYDAIVEYFSSKGETQYNYNVPKIMKELRKASRDAIKDTHRNIKDVFMMGEWWGSQPESEQYLHLGNTKALDSLYDGYWKNNWYTKRSVKEIKGFLKRLKKVNKDYRWTPFLDNHDVERWVNSYRRSKPGFNGAMLKTAINKDAVDALSVSLFQMLARPANPIIYYGDEIGYHGTRAAGDEKLRESMNWSDSKYNVKFYEKRSGKDHSLIQLNYSKDRPTADDIQFGYNQPFMVVKEMAKIRRDYNFMTKSKARTITDVSSTLTKVSDLSFIRNDKDSKTKLLFIYSLGSEDTYNLKRGQIVEKILLKNNVKINGNQINAGRHGYIVIKLK